MSRAIEVRFWRNGAGAWGDWLPLDSCGLQRDYRARILRERRGGRTTGIVWADLSLRFQWRVQGVAT
jgi:hypothetical protein